MSAKGNYAQTALADLDNDGRLEYIVGQQYGTIFWYKFHAPDRWTRHILGTDSPSDVGGCVLDVDGDGYLDFVAGGAWYRNSRTPDQPFERIVFDADLTGVHDVLAADLDGDGQPEIVTMSDKNSLRWYKIPADSTQPWLKTEIGPAVHAGAAVGDLDHDGHLDVVRTNVWFQNVNGDGTRWVEHPIGPTRRRHRIFSLTSRLMPPGPWWWMSIVMARMTSFLWMPKFPAARSGGWKT